MMINLKTITAAIAFISITVSAQQKDSISGREVNSLPIYPRIKYLTVSYDQAASTDYKVKNTGHTDNEGTISRGRLQVIGTVPILKKKGFTLSATGMYTREKQEIKETINPIFNETSKNYSFENINATINGSYITKLWNRPFLASASVIVGSRDFINPEKVSGLVTGVMVFQKKPQTRFTLGLAGIIDPSSQVPAFPIITYWHQFKDPRWEVDIIMPTMVKLRRSDVLGGWLSAGADFNFFNYFLTDVPNTSKTFQNSYSELSLNISYEHIFAKNFMISGQAGYKTTLQNRILEVNEKYNDASIKVNISEAPFVKIGISYILTNKDLSKKIKNSLK